MYTASVVAAMTPIGSTRPTFVQFSRRVMLLGIWSKISSFLKYLKASKIRMVIVLALLMVLAGVLIALRDPSEYGPESRLLPYNPY